jgi:tetratricopeptide (TPR) repeat protein
VAIVVLGMHRSGTSCIAGMIEAAGIASAGDAIRNWDNARGHFEMKRAVRLDDRVLAHSGGHWLAPPRELGWTAEHEIERDALLGDPRALIKDPRALLVLPFWRASTIPFHAIAVVRHPLAVARSLEAWRELPIAEGLALWVAHNRALAADRDHVLIDFDAPGLIDSVHAACTAIAGRTIDRAAIAAAFEPQLVHHDRDDAPELPILHEALALHRELVGGERAIASISRPAFPREAVARAMRWLDAGDHTAALVPARDALAASSDPAAVLVPLVAAFSRKRAYAEARELVRELGPRGDGLGELLFGKLALAAGDPATAATHLEAACAVASPYFAARNLLPHALRGAGRVAEARAAMELVAAAALYAHGPLSTLAEWSWLDGHPDAALAAMQRAIDAAPPHRRGRLRTRRAEWLASRGDRDGARRELELAVTEDPGYARSRDLIL